MQIHSFEAALQGMFWTERIVGSCTRLTMMYHAGARAGTRIDDSIGYIRLPLN